MNVDGVNSQRLLESNQLVEDKKAAKQREIVQSTLSPAGGSKGTWYISWALSLTGMTTVKFLESLHLLGMLVVYRAHKIWC